MTPRSLVVCLGNDLVGDDGAGLAVHDRLAGQALPAGVRLARLGLGGLALLDLMDGEDLMVVVDAVALGGEAGTLHVQEGERLPGSGRPAVSAHGIGIAEALEVGRLLQPLRVPRRVVLVGIEGRRFDELGTGLTPGVAAAVPTATAVVEALLREAGPGRETRWT